MNHECFFRCCLIAHSDWCLKLIADNFRCRNNACCRSNTIISCNNSVCIAGSRWSHASCNQRCYTVISYSSSNSCSDSGYDMSCFHRGPCILWGWVAAALLEMEIRSWADTVSVFWETSRQSTGRPSSEWIWLELSVSKERKKKDCFRRNMAEGQPWERMNMKSEWKKGSYLQIHTYVHTRSNMTDIIADI